ncbi:MAG: thioredoxin-like domain-containing protein [Armatimonadota bacterium]
MSERYRGKVRAPEFPAGLEWLNVDRPLSLRDLRGKVVILDFWTFCCINCQHVLPQLQRLEERFPTELVVVGVHSAKFDAERETYNIRQAVLRHDVRHPVVNDRGFVLWRAYAVKAWPTLVIIDPDGMVIGAHSGEFDADDMAAVLEEMIAAWKREGRLDPQPLATSPERLRQPESVLSFPGKVLADAGSDRLYVADSDHHRVVETDLHGRVQRIFGSGEPGWADGSPARARFRFPQGMALHGDGLYVADTENHLIRKIALHSGVVSTVAGTGRQARPWPTPGSCRETALNSPWDLHTVGNWLYVAMAGSHQIWRLDVPSGRLELFAGDGREALLDGPRLEARLAQPSGLSSDGLRLWFADSETSSIRWVPLQGEGAVRTAIGEGLFEFGDVDGAQKTARLQHPLDVECAGGLVYVADSYNNRIKVYDPVAGEISRFTGSGEPGLFDAGREEACLWEPGGLSAAGDVLYTADTNNGAVRAVSLRTGEVRTIELA